MDHLHTVYTAQANYTPSLVRLVTSQPNTCVVTVSGHEIQLALACGVSADRIIFNGNGKQSWELCLAVEQRCLLNVDSVFDLRRLLDVCRRNIDVGGDPVRVLLRLNPDIDPVSCPVSIG